MRTKTVRRPNVGASVRTVLKHRLLDKLLGKTVGATRNLRWVTGFVMIDATAGTGEGNAWSGTSSPEIMEKHREWAHRNGVPVRVLLIEKDPATAAMLRFNTEESVEVTVIEGSYRDLPVVQILRQAIDEMGPRPAVFLHIDPNHVDHVELIPELRAILPATTTLLITLGCNVGGLHRMSYQERLAWFHRIDYILTLMGQPHDACFIALWKDDARWAYLLTVPRGWRVSAEAMIAEMNRTWPKGVKSAWFRDIPSPGVAALPDGKDLWDLAKYVFLKSDGSEDAPW